VIREQRGSAPGGWSGVEPLERNAKTHRCEVKIRWVQRSLMGFADAQPVLRHVVFRARACDGSAR
jgi:hypothetical protein